MMFPARVAPSAVCSLGDFHRFQRGFAAMDFAGVVGMQVVQAEAIEQREVVVLVGVRRGEEFVAEENRVRAGEIAERLHLVAHLGAPGGEADHRLRHQDARGGDGADEFKRVHELLLGQRRAFDGDKRVDGHGVGLRVHAREFDEHLEAVVHGFAHAEDAAGADFEAGLADVRERLEAFIVGARGDYRGIKFARGVEVVVVDVAAGFLEARGLRLGQHAERAADFEAEFFHAGDGFQHAIKLLSVTDAAPRGAHAKACRAAGFGFLCVGQDGAGLHQLLGFEAGVVMRGLRAIGAIFGARAGLDGLERAKLDAGGVLVPVMHLLRAEDERGERQRIDFADLIECVGHGVKGKAEWWSAGVLEC